MLKKVRKSLRMGLVIAGMACLAGAAGDAAAQRASTSSDKDMASKKGLDALGSKKIDNDKLPGKLQIGFAIGSVVTMIAVFKYL